RFLFELLVPATGAQLLHVDGDRSAYDRELRPRLAQAAMVELQDAGVEPDVWKIEGLDRRQDCVEVVQTAHRGGRESVGCIVLGRAEDERRVTAWVTTAASVPGFIGFAVGRTVFWEALRGWRQGSVTREAAVARIARNYRHFAEAFMAA